MTLNPNQIFTIQGITVRELSNAEESSKEHHFGKRIQMNYLDRVIDQKLEKNKKVKGSSKKVHKGIRSDRSNGKGKSPLKGVFGFHTR